MSKKYFDINVLKLEPKEELLDNHSLYRVVSQTNSFNFKAELEDFAGFAIDKKVSTGLFSGYLLVKTRQLNYTNPEMSFTEIPISEHLDIVFRCLLDELGNNEMSTNGSFEIYAGEDKKNDGYEFKLRFWIKPFEDYTDQVILTTEVNWIKKFGKKGKRYKKVQSSNFERLVYDPNGKYYQYQDEHKRPQLQVYDEEMVTEYKKQCCTRSALIFTVIDTFNSTYSSLMNVEFEKAERYDGRKFTRAKANKEFKKAIETLEGINLSYDGSEPEKEKELIENLSEYIISKYDLELFTDRKDLPTISIVDAEEREDDGYAPSWNTQHIQCDKIQTKKKGSKKSDPVIDTALKELAIKICLANGKTDIFGIDTTPIDGWTFYDLISKSENTYLPIKIIGDEFEELPECYKKIDGADLYIVTDKGVEIAFHRTKLSALPNKEEIAKIRKDKSEAKYSYAELREGIATQFKDDPENVRKRKVKRVLRPVRYPGHLSITLKEWEELLKELKKKTFYNDGKEFELSPHTNDYVHKYLKNHYEDYNSALQQSFKNKEDLEKLVGGMLDFNFWKFQGDYYFSSGFYGSGIDSHNPARNALFYRIKSSEISTEMIELLADITDCKIIRNIAYPVLPFTRKIATEIKELSKDKKEKIEKSSAD